MLRQHLILLAALGALAACDTPGGTERMQGTFLAVNNFRVVPSADPTRFEVVANAGGGGSDFFCAAADYAYKRLNAPTNARVVLVAPVGPSVANPGGRGAFFTVVPRGTVPPSKGISIRMRRAGENYSIAHARNFCPSLGAGILN